MSPRSTGSAADFLPRTLTLPALRRAATRCQGCELYACGATQVVFGEGPAPASVMLVGEQPGDREDTAGKPFVGPAGRILGEALAAAGIDRAQVYTTNAVKHFRFRERGKRRIHEKPNLEHVRACRPWLDAELGVVRPRIVVALGATAAQALLGRNFRLTHHRGEFFDLAGLADGLPPLALAREPVVTATFHPSSIVRQRDRASREQAMAGLVSDLALVRHRMDEIEAQRELPQLKAQSPRGAATR